MGAVMWSLKPVHMSFFRFQMVYSEAYKTNLMLLNTLCKVQIIWGRGDSHISHLLIPWETKISRLKVFPLAEPFFPDKHWEVGGKRCIQTCRLFLFLSFCDVLLWKLKQLIKLEKLHVVTTMWGYWLNILARYPFSARIKNLTTTIQSG